MIVVDDDRDGADSLVVLLELEGFTPRAFYRAAAALEGVRDWPPDAAVIDILMPGMDGHQLAIAMRRRIHPCPAFVAITGHPGVHLAARSSELGFAAHLMKPFEAQVLCRALWGLSGS